MSQGSEPVEGQDGSEAPRPKAGSDGAQEAPARPPIRGVRLQEVTPFDDGAVAALAPVDDPVLEPAVAVDPWGAQEPEAFEPREEGAVAELAPAEGPRQGGGILTIPLLCIGIAIIACVTLLPQADENHQLAWEREKLRVDLIQLKEQGRVNEEFLQRVSDDPTLSERLASRQMKYIREGTSVLQLKGSGKEEMSPFHLVSVPPPPPMPPYEPVGGALATIVRQPRAQLYLSGGALLLIAMGLVLGYVPKGTPQNTDA